MKKIIKITFSMLGILLLVSIGIVFYLSRDVDLHEEITIQDVDIKSLPDGTYNGSFSKGRWSNDLGVTIFEGKIVDISTNKTVLFEKEEVTEEIFSKVIRHQELTVDTVSGATITSKAYLKSIENALSLN